MMIMMDEETYQDVITKDEMLAIIKKSISSNNFILNGFSITPLSEHPVGFLGIHSKITFNVTTTNETKELHYFVKKLPVEMPQYLDYALRTRAFYKEIELYKTLFEDIKDVQKDGTKWCPDYFLSRDEEMFVVEDLTSKGYYMMPERMPMGEVHVKATLKAMAAMHAGSFIFEDAFNRGLIFTRSPIPRTKTSKGVTMGELYPHLTFETEACEERGHPGNTYYEVGMRSQVHIVDLIPGLTIERRNEIKKKLPGILRKLMQLVKTSKRYRNVFLHGDLWSNNILFRKDETGALSAVLVDFQLVRYAPPAHDVILFLHLVQTKEFRQRYQNQLLDYYYQCLGDELSPHGLSVTDVLPKHEFLESCEYYYDLGLLSSILYFQLILLPPNIARKSFSTSFTYTETMMIDRSKIIVEAFKDDNIFRTRMTEVMNDLIERYEL